jgi:acyl-coenzyme A thioesterase PaaI-like protein
MASAAVSRSDFKNTVVTVDISVSFLAPASGTVTCEAEATGGGKSMCFCEGRVLDASGKLLARALGTFKYLRLTEETTRKDSHQG